MNQEEEDIFVKMCSEKYDLICPKTTVRGIPISDGKQENRERQITEEWGSIAAKMNEVTNVGIFVFVFVNCILSAIVN